MVELTWKLNINKCFIVISNKNKPYHYFRQVKNISKTGLYCVEYFNKNEDGTKREVSWMMIENGKELTDFDGMLLSIERLKLEKLRLKKLNQLLNK